MVTVSVRVCAFVFVCVCVCVCVSVCLCVFVLSGTGIRQGGRRTPVGLFAGRALCTALHV